MTDKTIVIPGHGAVGGKADLVLFRDVLIEIREKVAALKKQGHSLAEVVAAKPGARYDEEWGKGFMTPSLYCTGVSGRLRAEDSDINELELTPISRQTVHLKRYFICTEYCVYQALEMMDFELSFLWFAEWRPNEF